MPDRRKFPENLKRGGGPGRGRGRVQIAAKRAPLLAGEGLISTAEVLAIAHARQVAARHAGPAASLLAGDIRS
jgi:hypothetical protein